MLSNLSIEDSVSKSVEIQNPIGLIADADMATSLRTSFFIGQWLCPRPQNKVQSKLIHYPINLQIAVRLPIDYTEQV
jgi:hypothetical protein